MFVFRNGKEYLCRTCRQYLKNPKKNKIPRKCVFAKRKEQKYKCSSFHEVFESSDEMVLVTEKKYNFECDVVKKVLSDSIRCFDMYNNEYLCRECDECLDTPSQSEIFSIIVTCSLCSYVLAFQYHNTLQSLKLVVSTFQELTLEDPMKPLCKPNFCLKLVEKCLNFGLPCYLPCKNSH